MDYKQEHAVLNTETSMECNVGNIMIPKRLLELPNEHSYKKLQYFYIFFFLLLGALQLSDSLETKTHLYIFRVN